MVEALGVGTCCVFQLCWCSVVVYLKNKLPDTQAKFHILFLFFSASMFSVSLAALFVYHCWLVCKNRSTLGVYLPPVFRLWLQSGKQHNGNTTLPWWLGLCVLAEAVRSPVFGHGTDKNGFSLGFSKNLLQVFGDESKYWPVPVFSRWGLLRNTQHSP